MVLTFAAFLRAYACLVGMCKCVASRSNGSDLITIHRDTLRGNLDKDRREADAEDAEGEN